MKRKILSVLLMLCMLLPMGVITAHAWTAFPVQDYTINFEDYDYELYWPHFISGMNCQTGEDKNFHKVHFSIVDDADATHGKVLRIADAGYTDHYPQMSWVTKVTPGAKYRFSGWTKTTEGSADPQVSTTYFTDFIANSGYTKGESRLLSVREDDAGKWKYFEQYFTVPFDSEKLIYDGMFSIRLHGAGEMFVDGLEIKNVENPPRFTADSGFFYYRDETMGRATVSLNTRSFPEYEGNTVMMKIMDGETVLEQAAFDAQVDAIEWNFPTKKMTEIAKSYTLRVEYKNAGGTLLETQDKEVLIYNRPTNLSKDGYLIADDGTKYNMVVAGSLYPRSYAEMAAYGVNVAASCYTSVDMDPEWGVPHVLEEAKAAGIKVLIPLYAGMKPAGHVDNVQNTINCINAIKDHPALLGYMVMDEPFGHAADAGGPEGMYQWLQDSYKLIRQYDQEHLIYMVETEMEYVGLTGKCVDLLTVDPYVGSKRVADRGSHVSQDVINGIAALGNRKPLTSMVQAWPWNGENSSLPPYMPTANDIRSFLYQSLIGGADGIGYYGVETTKTGHPKDQDSFRDKDPEKGYNDLWNVGVTYFNKNEWDDARKAFITGEYPTFAQSALVKESPYWYKAFVKDNDLYVVVINRNDANTTISIPLTSLDGSVTIGNFTAEADEISGIGTITGNGTLSATLSPAQVVRFKLTVSEDLSGLTTSPYRDIYTSWAKSAIDTAYQAGVTNEKGVHIYAPEEDITRGDFALFLVRTLGLTASGTGNFADVNPYAEYADAIRIGKALGYLTAASGENYLPEEPISHKECIEIAARAMRYKEKGEVNAFADYIVDIVAKMREDFPGAFSVAGNMTRAEAAVVMQYILDWDEEDLVSEFASLSQTEKSTVLELLLSEGTTTNGVWKAEKDGIIVVCNGTGGEKFSTSTVTVPHIKHLYGTVVSASLGNGQISGWNFYNGTWGTIYSLADETYEGGGALRIKAPGTDASKVIYAYQRVANVTPGGSYTLKARVKTVSGNAQIGTNFFDGTTWKASGATNPVGAANGEWNEVSYTFTVPATANVAEINLYASKTTGEVYWDAVTLWEGNTEFPITNGDFETTTGSNLTLSLPGKTTNIFVPVSGAFQGVERENVLHTTPIAGGVLRCPEGAWAAQYEADGNGVKQLVQFYVTGGSLRNWTEKLVFFRWDQQLRPIE